MFDGRTSSRREVSVGGTKRELDRTALLATARKQREERALERLRFASAVRIQKLARGRSCRLRVESGLRQDFDVVVTKIGKMKAIFAASTSRSFQVPPATLETLFGSFSFFCRLPDVDKGRLRALGGLYLESCSLAPNNAAVTKTSENNIWHLAESESGEFKAQSTVWRKLLTVFFSICLSVVESSLERGDQGNPSNDDIEDQCITIVDSVASKLISEGSNPQCGAFHNQILSILVESSCRCLEKAIIVDAPSHKTQRTSTTLTSILLLALSKRSAASKIYWEHLSLHILGNSRVLRSGALQPLLRQLSENGNSGWLHALAHYRFCDTSRPSLPRAVAFFGCVCAVLLGVGEEGPWSASANPRFVSPLPTATIKSICDSISSDEIVGSNVFVSTSAKPSEKIWLSELLRVLGHAPLAFLLLQITTGQPIKAPQHLSSSISILTEGSHDQELWEDDRDSLGGLEWLRRESAATHMHRAAEDQRSLSDSGAANIDSYGYEGLGSVLALLLDKALVVKMLDFALSQSESEKSSNTLLLLCGVYSRILCAAPLVAETKFESSLPSFVHPDALARDRDRDVEALIVNQVAWAPRAHLAGRLWRALSGPLAPALQFLLGDDVAGTSFSVVDVENAAAAVHILCAALYTQLSLTDDEDFLVSQAVLSTSELRSLVVFLGRLVERLAGVVSIESAALRGSEFATPGTSQALQCRLRLSALRLFNLLHALDERRGLFGPEIWHLKLPALAKWTSASVNGNGMDDEDEMMDVNVGMRHASSTENSLGRKERLLLSCSPQVVPFSQRVEIFQRFLEVDKRKSAGSGFMGMAMGMGPQGAQVQVRRDELVHDAFKALQGVSSVQLKGRLRIEFISAQGYHEAGIDGGGLFKEFLDVLTHQAWDPALGLFVTLDSQQLWPNPASLAAFGDSHLHYFEFLGRMLGKAMYDKILVEGQFCEPFLNALKGTLNHIDDLVALDAQLHRGLVKMKAMDASELQGLGLNFEAERYEFGRVVTSELVAGGSRIAVTRENVSWYVQRLAHFKLNEEVRLQCRAFLTGFHELVPLAWLRMFSPRELQLLIGGDAKRLDTADLRRNVAYHGCADREPYIDAFWAVVDEMSASEQGLLLKFVTSCSRQPLLGFAHLQPRFGIQMVPAITPGDDPSAAPRLPSAATCMNLLKLPRYADALQLRDKLLYAIGSNSGFELS